MWLYTGSHSMFAESIHSVADTVNQIILAFGLHKSAKVSWTDLIFYKVFFVWPRVPRKNHCFVGTRLFFYLSLAWYSCEITYAWNWILLVALYLVSIFFLIILLINYNNFVLTLSLAILFGCLIVAFISFPAHGNQNNAVHCISFICIRLISFP